MATNKTRIVLADGKSYDLVRLKGNSKEASNLVWQAESDPSSPEYMNAKAKYPEYKLKEAPELSSMGHHFSLESGGMHSYLNEHALNRNDDVFFVMKGKEPIAFFSLHKWMRGSISLGVIYVKRNYRGLMGGAKGPDLGKGRMKGTGHLLVEEAARIARKMGYSGISFSEMSSGMERTFRKFVKDPSSMRNVKRHTIDQEEGDGGYDGHLAFNKRRSRKQRRNAATERAKQRVFARRMR